MTTSGAGSIGLLATGSGESETPAPSQITVQGVTVSTSGAAVAGGPTANEIEVDNGAMANITNGSVTTAAPANGAVGVAATGGAQVTISGTTINSNGNGSQGLFVTGSGSSLTASGLTVTASGNNDLITGFNPGAASNNAFGGVFHWRDAVDKHFDVDDDGDASLRGLYRGPRGDDAHRGHDHHARETTPSPAPPPPSRARGAGRRRSSPAPS